MIVRVLGDTQYDLPDTDASTLEEFEHRLDRAIETGDEAAYGEALSALIGSVRSAGKRLDPTTIISSDLTVPPEGSTIADLNELLSEESVDTVSEGN